MKLRTTSIASSACVTAASPAQWILAASPSFSQLPSQRIRSGTVIMVVPRKQQPRIGIGEIGLVEGGGLGAGHAVEEHLDVIGLHMRAAKLLAQRKQLVARVAEHEAGLDRRHRADRPGGQFAAIVEPLQRGHDRLHAGGIDERGDAIGVEQ